MKFARPMLVSLSLSSPAFADLTINNLSAGTTLGGTEQLPMFQTANPAVTTTPSAIKTYVESVYGTGVVTFLTTPSSANLAAAVTDETGSGALVFATSPTLVTPALGTPSAIVLTNATGMPIAGVTGLGTGVATFLATPSSANLATAVTDETGSGALVFGTSPTLVTPALGTPSAVVLTNATGMPFTGMTGRATSSQVPTDVAYLDVNQVFTSSQRVTVQTPTISTATFTPNFDTGADFVIGLTSACPCTLANPSTTPVAGQHGIVYVVQDGTGSRTVGTWGSQYFIAGGTSAITLSTAASAIDVFSYTVKDSTHIILSGPALNVTH